jgi:hypothetical protein
MTGSKLLAGCILGLTALHASALTVTTSSANAFDVTSITDLVTGSGMAGLTVTLTTNTGASSNATWAAISGSQGGASTASWSLNATGNTFAALWQFSYSGTAPVASLVLNGVPGNISFDRAAPNPGSPGSFGGSDFTVDLNNDGLADNPAWTITYSRPLGVGGSAPLGDEFGVLTIDFGTGGFTGQSFSFLQDSDIFVPASNGGGNTVPEPASLLLAGLGLSALAFVRRRHK